MMEQPSPDSKTGVQYILIFEPDATVAQRISMAVWGETEMEPKILDDATRAIAFIETHLNSIFAATVRLLSQNANDLLKKLAEFSIPVIAYDTDIDDTARRKCMTVGIADMIMGEPACLPAAIGKSVGKIARNRTVGILVVDDSRSMRSALSRFLSKQCYQLLEAEDGVKALKILRKHPEIKLVITDNEMPNMDGFTLIKEIRRQFSKDELAVIGISAKNNARLSIRFIDNGANDFLHKPFQKEELYCRVGHNVEMLNRFEIIRDLSNKDPLTRLFNRRYFFDNCEDFVTTSKGGLVTVAMIDIDFFKRFNDTYGHDVGDEVLKKVSSLIGTAFEDNGLVSRFGGEEFCILAIHDKKEDIFAQYDQLRRDIEASTVDVDGEDVTITVSCGICTEKADMQVMLKEADRCLYTAKDSGRNCVVSS